MQECGPCTMLYFYRISAKIYQTRTPKRNEICFQTHHRSKHLTHCLKTDVLNVSASSVCAVHFDKFRPWLNIRTSEACPRHDTEAFLHTLVYPFPCVSWKTLLSRWQYSYIVYLYSLQLATLGGWKLKNSAQACYTHVLLESQMVEKWISANWVC